MVIIVDAQPGGQRGAPFGLEVAGAGKDRW